MHIYLPLSLDLFNDISSVFKLIFQKFCLNVLRGSILVKMYVTYLIGGGGGGGGYVLQDPLDLILHICCLLQYT